MKRIFVAYALSLLSFVFGVVCAVVGEWKETDRCHCGDDWCCRVATEDECPSNQCYCEHLLDNSIPATCAVRDPHTPDFYIIGFRVSLAVFCVSTFTILLYFCIRAFGKRARPLP